MKKMILTLAIVLFASISFGAEFTTKTEWEIAVHADKIVGARLAEMDFKDGVMISKKFIHRISVAPNEDCSIHPEAIQAICAAVHTPGVKAEYQAFLDSQAE